MKLADLHEATRAFNVDFDAEDKVSRPKTQSERDKLAADVKDQRGKTRGLDKDRVHSNARRGSASGSMNHGVDRAYDDKFRTKGPSVKKVDEAEHDKPEMSVRKRMEAAIKKEWKHYTDADFADMTFADVESIYLDDLELPDFRKKQ